MIPFLVFALRHCDRQHFYIEAVRARAAHHAARVRVLEQTGLPKGVVNLVNGGKAAVDALLDHPKIRAVSFVGSTPIAKVCLCASWRHRKASAVPGRRQESRHRPARCRYENGYADHQR